MLCCWLEKMKLLLIVEVLSLLSFMGGAVNLRTVLENTIAQKLAGQAILGNEAVQEQRTLFHVGCFTEPDSRHQVLRSLSENNEIESCSSICDTPFFAIRPERSNVCICLPRAGDALFENDKTRRQSFGECSLSFPHDDGLVDVHFKAIDATTNQENCNTDVLGVRSKITDENNAPPGMDMVTGRQKPSIFDPYPSGCGTNMWDIQSGTQGQLSFLSTETRSISEFVRQRKTGFEGSVSGGLSVGTPAFSFGGSFSASTEISRLVNSEKQNLEEKKVVESSAHLFLANVVIEKSKKHFATFTGTGSSGFLGRIVEYYNAGLPDKLGISILQDFGQMAVTKASYGGYFQSKAVFTNGFQAEAEMTDFQLEACFEAGASASGVVQGATVGGNAGVSACTDFARQKLSSSSQELIEQSDSQFFVGGAVVGGEFEVSAGSSVLLLKPELYSENEKPKLELLADFLHKDIVSPIACSRALLTEEQFHEVHIALRDLTLRLFGAVDAKLANCQTSCSQFGISELTQFELGSSIGNSQISCSCVEPVGNAFECLQHGGVISPNAAVCCKASCGICGGLNCELRPGGSDACCEGPILFGSGNSCSTKTAPCKFDDSAVADATIEIAGDRLIEAAACLVTIRPKKDKEKLNANEWRKVRQVMSRILGTRFPEDLFQLSNLLVSFAEVLSDISPEKRNTEEWRAIRRAANNALPDLKNAVDLSKAAEFQEAFESILDVLKKTTPKKHNEEEWAKIRKCIKSIPEF